MPHARALFALTCRDKYGNLARSVVNVYATRLSERIPVTPELVEEEESIDWR